MKDILDFIFTMFVTFCILFTVFHCLCDIYEVHPTLNHELIPSLIEKCTENGGVGEIDIRYNVVCKNGAVFKYSK